MMRCFVISLLLLAGAGSAVAQSGQPLVCLRALDIDHTKTPNDSTILFFMKNRNVWSTTLKSMFDGLVYAALTAGTFGWLWPK